MRVQKAPKYESCQRLEYMHNLFYRNCTRVADTIYSHVHIWFTSGMILLCKEMEKVHFMQTFSIRLQNFCKYSSVPLHLIIGYQLYTYTYVHNGSNKLRWIGRFALKEGHLCRICHCVHFIVQFAGLFL